MDNLGGFYVKNGLFIDNPEEKGYIKLINKGFVIRNRDINADIYWIALKI